MWAIRSLGKSRSYYKMPTAIGPCFGATVEEAVKFKTKCEAALHMAGFPALVLAEVVKLPKERGGV